MHNHIRFLIDADSGHMCAMFSAKNIDAETQEEQRLLEAAQLDRMTMLLNRETTMERIRKVLAEETCVKAREVLCGIQKICAAYTGISLSGSIGVSLYSECGSTLEQLYANADSALYQAKCNGKNQFIVSAER